MMLAMALPLVRENKMKNKYFVIPTQIMKEKIPNVHFVYPLTSFSVGFSHTYELEDLTENDYGYINKILDSKDIEKLKAKKEKLKHLKGIIFEDFGVYQLLKNENTIEKIFFASHANCSRLTVASLLKYMDKVILSLDITVEEIKEITNIDPERIILYTFGPMPYLYSRRTLVRNYEITLGKKITKELEITEPITKKNFILKESDDGTICFDEKMLEARELEKIKAYAYFLNLDWLKEIDLPSWLKDFEEGKPLLNTTTGFLHQKTIYQLPPRKED